MPRYHLHLGRKMETRCLSLDRHMGKAALSAIPKFHAAIQDWALSLHCLTYTVAEPLDPELIAVQFCHPKV